MRVLFVPMTGGRGIGPICRCTAVADELIDCEILFLAEKKFAHFLSDAGYKYVEDISPKPIGNQGQIFYWNDAAFVMGLCQNEFVRSAFAHQMKVVEAFKPDVIFTEYNLTILLVAKVLNIPIVSTINWADTDSFSLGEKKHTLLFPEAIKEYNAILSEYSIDNYNSIGDLALSVTVLTAPTTVFQQPELQNMEVSYVGELLNRSLEIDENIEASIATNNIYVYLSSSDLPTIVWLKAIFSIALQLDNTFYLVMKKEDIISIRDMIVPDNIVIREWMPSLSVLKKSALAVHAGSANIISGTLMCGVPSLMIPLDDGERLYNSQAIQRLGCGLIISRDGFCDSGVCLSTIQSIINNRTYADNCKALGEQVKNLGGAKAIVQIISSLAES